MAHLSFSPQRLRSARLAAGKTTTQLAAEIDRAASMVVGYEAGRWRPSLDSLAAMADALDIPVDDLFAAAEPAVDLAAA